MRKLSAAATDVVRALVADLVAGQYEKVKADGRLGRLTVDELRRAISEYGRTLIDLPSDFEEFVEVYRGQNPNEYSIDLALWTLEEGRSDLTLSGTLSEQSGVVSIQIDDVHVL